MRTGIRGGGEVPGWTVLRLRPGHVAIYPNRDTMPHDADAEDDCPCSPRVVPVENDNGPMGWLYVHNSADNREVLEREEAARGAARADVR